MEALSAMKAKYFLGHAIDGYAFIGRKGSAITRERKKDMPQISTICPMTLRVAKKMLKEFDARGPCASGMKIFELKEIEC